MAIEEVEYLEKARGEMRFFSDGPDEGRLQGRLLCSPYPCAAITGVRFPVMPVGYYVVDHRDVPEGAVLELLGGSWPVFPKDRVEYAGQPVLLVMGPDLDEVERILGEIQVDYAPTDPVLDVRDSREDLGDFGFEKGEVDEAFDQADQTYDEAYSVRAELRTLEPVGLVGRYAGGVLTLSGSGECPRYLPQVVAQAVGLSDGEVEIDPYPGEGKGDSYPPSLACIAAAAAIKAKGQPVQVMAGSAEGGHTVFTRYQVAAKNGRVSAMDVDIVLDGGCWTALSPKAVRRAMLSACGGYNIPSVRVRGRAAKTNRSPVEQCRGLGAPQVIFALETVMCHLAQDFGMDSLAFKERHIAREEDETPTGGEYQAPIPLSAMVRELDPISGYRDSHRAWREPQSGRFRKGAGLAFSFSGGERERDVLSISEEDFQGDQFTSYGWGVNTVEVELDTWTGVCQVTKAHGLYDVRRWGDVEGVRGQLEGEFLQGLCQARGQGAELPSSMDLPDLNVRFYSGSFSNLENTGELGLAGGMAAYLAAVEQAVGGSVNRVPFTPADCLRRVRSMDRARAEEEAER